MIKNCKCGTSCGCGDVVLTTPPSCTNGNPNCTGDNCPETFAAGCVVYMGDDIANVGIKKGDRVNDIIQRLVTLIVNAGCAYPTSACQAVIGFASTNIAATTISLKWSPVTTALSYQVEYRLTTSGTWLLNPSVTGTTDVIGGLTSGSAYYVRVNTTCASGNCYSITLQITTI